MVSLFVALKLPQAVREQLALLQHGLDNASWVLQQNMHLTLRFIGQIESERFDDICAALSMVRSKPVSFRLLDVGHFSRGSVPHAVWVGVKPSRDLIDLRKRIEQSFASVDVTTEARKYTPHVTIARLRGTKQKHLLHWLTANASFSMPTTKFSDFTLYASHRSRKGSIYHILETFPLNGCK